MVHPEDGVLRPKHGGGLIQHKEINLDGDSNLTFIVYIISLRSSDTRVFRFIKSAYFATV